MCAELYAHFLSTLGDKSYYPEGAPELCEHRLFAIFHSNTPKHNKDVVLRSMTNAAGIVRVVFATTALGMGVNFVGVYSTVHYGLLDRLMTTSRRVGELGEMENHDLLGTIRCSEQKKNLTNPRNREIVAVRQYLENVSDCRQISVVMFANMACTHSNTNIRYRHVTTVTCTYLLNCIVISYPSLSVSSFCSMSVASSSETFPSR